MRAVNVMRMVAQGELFMPETCDIERMSAVRDEYGDETQTWAVAYSKVPCMRVPLSGQELVLADRLAPEVNTKITVPYWADITTDDRVVVASRRYSIDYIPDVSPAFSASIEMLCRFVETV